MKTLYEILEVSEKASSEIIEKAYKVLAKKYHPDLQQPQQKKMAEEKMKQLNEAYEILGNETRRREYDNELEQIKQREIEKNYEVKQEFKQNDNIRQDINNNINQEVKKQYTTNQGYNKIEQEWQKILEEERIRRQELYRQREMQQQIAYEDYLRSLGYKIKYKWTWKKFKDLCITIGVMLLILLILWLFPPTKRIMIQFYEENIIVRLLVNTIAGIFRGIAKIFVK